MNFIIKILLAVTIFPISIFGQNYPEVIFENSTLDGSYAKSKVNYTGSSWVENVNKRLILSDSIYFTPGNALSLKYISKQNGNWQSYINYPDHNNNIQLKDYGTLNLRLYIHSNQSTKSDLPKIFIKHNNLVSDTIKIQDYISTLEHQKWIHIKIPIKDFIRNIEIESITSIGLSQNQTSDKTHHIYIDQIEFAANKYSEIPLRSAAILNEVKSYDKAIQLKWQIPLTPSIRYVKIYRSTDGKLFSPINIRPITYQSYLDFVPKTGEKYHYKITWLDYNYKESPSSEIHQISTSDLNDDGILKLIQMLSVNYFVENFDINSGMFPSYRSKNKVIVSTHETAGAILSLIVGVNNDFISRQNALNRISKIAYFLLKSQNKQGFYSTYYDVRKGIPEYMDNMSVYDVQATASLIEALLIAREYFSADNELEKDLRARITTIYNQINWNIAINQDGLLKSKLKLIDEADTAILMGHSQSINAYLLALSSPKSTLTKSSYFNAIYHKNEVVDKTNSSSVNPYAVKNIFNESDHEINNLSFQEPVDTTVKISIFNSTEKYGLDLPFSFINNDFLAFSKPFLTIKPELINDSLINWKEALYTYIQYLKRRDNENSRYNPNGNIWGYYKDQNNILTTKINPTINSISVGFDKDVGKKGLVTLYKEHNNKLLTEYGFKSWIDIPNNEISDELVPINQFATAVMIENARTGLIWSLYEKIPELQNARKLILR